MKKIRIGHMGIAHDHSYAKLETVMKYPEIFEVVGIYEPNDQLWENEKHRPCYQALKRMTKEELFDQKPDAMLIESYELDLVAMAQECVDRGIHVHLDKPGGDDIHAYHKLLKSAQEKGVVMQLAYMFRYNPGVLYALEAVRSGKLGRIYEVDAIMNVHHSVYKRTWQKGFDAGIMFFLGCHMVDLIYLFQGQPNRVIPMNRRTGIDGVDVVDHGFALMEYDNGISVARSNSTEVNGSARRQLVICGEKGTIEINPLEASSYERYAGIRMTLTDYYPEVKEDPRMPFVGYFGDFSREVPIEPVAGRYDSMLMDFAEFVWGNKVNPYTYEYEFEVHKLILAACGQDIDYKNMPY